MFYDDLMPIDRPDLEDDFLPFTEIDTMGEMYEPYEEDEYLDDDFFDDDYFDEEEDDYLDDDLYAYDDPDEL